MTSYATTDDLRAYLPQVADLGVQAITITGATGGDTYTLIYEGVATGAILSDATATTVQTALRAIAAIGSSGVNVRGSPGAYVASFQGTLATDAGPLSSDASGLSPGGTVQIAPALDAVLSDCLDRASGIVRGAMRSLLADPAFDYAAYTTATAQIVRGWGGQYLAIPAHQIGTVTIVSYEAGSNPATFTALNTNEWDEMSDGRLYRAVGWSGSYGGGQTRYEVTANWGYGATVPPSIVEVTLEVAVNIWRSRDKGGFTDTIGVDGSGATVQVSGLTNLQRQVLTAERDQLIILGV